MVRCVPGWNEESHRQVTARFQAGRPGHVRNIPVPGRGARLAPRGGGPALVKPGGMGYLARDGKEVFR